MVIILFLLQFVVGLLIFWLGYQDDDGSKRLDRLENDAFYSLK